MKKGEGLSEGAHWKEVISAKVDYWDFGLRSVWRRKYLLYLLIRKLFLIKYKQTILGPIWILLQPLLISGIYLVVFKGFLGISTGGIPSIIFYLFSNIVWIFFSTSFTRVSHFVFADRSILERVYLPKQLLIFSYVIFELVSLVVSLLFFVGVWWYYIYNGMIFPNVYMLFFPLIIFFVALLSIGLASILVRISIKYRDLQNIFQFLVQLLLFLTPIFYPLSTVENPLFRKVLLLNPMTGFIELARYGFFGAGHVSGRLLLYDVLVTLVVFVVGNMCIKKVENVYVDVI